MNLRSIFGCYSSKYSILYWTTLKLLVWNVINLKHTHTKKKKNSEAIRNCSFKESNLKTTVLSNIGKLNLGWIQEAVFFLSFLCRHSISLPCSPLLGSSHNVSPPRGRSIAWERKYYIRITFFVQSYFGCGWNPLNDVIAGAPSTLRLHSSRIAPEPLRRNEDEFHFTNLNKIAYSPGFRAKTKPFKVKTRLRPRLDTM